MKKSCIIFGVIVTLYGVFASTIIASESKPNFDPRSAVFVTNRDSSDVTIIDMKTDTIIERIACGNFCNPHMAMATDDGRYLVATGTQGNFAAIIDLATKEVTKVRLGIQPEHFTITPDDKLAYIGNMGSGTVSVVDIEEKREIKRIAGFFEPHGFEFVRVAVADGNKPQKVLNKVYVANIGAHEVSVIDVATQELVKRINVGSAYVMAVVDMPKKLTEIAGVAHPTLTLDLRYVYAADGNSNQVAVIDTATDEVIATIPVGDEPWRTYASPDGKTMVALNNGDKTISVIDTRTNKVIATFPGGEDMTGVNFVNGGKKAYVISRGESAVYVFDMERMKELKRIKLGNRMDLETASTTPDGKKVYLASSRTNSVFVFDADTDKYKQIPDVGLSPWAVTIIGSANYCH